MWAFPDAAALELRVAKINSDIDAAMKAARDDRRRRERGLLLSELPAELLQLILYSGLRFVSGSDDKTARIAYHGLAPPT